MPDKTLLPVKDCCLCNYSHSILHTFIEEYLRFSKQIEKKATRKLFPPSTKPLANLEKAYRTILEYVARSRLFNDLSEETELSFIQLHEFQSVQCEKFLVRLHIFLTAKCLPPSIKKHSSYEESLCVIHFIILEKQHTKSSSVSTIRRIEKCFAETQLGTLRKLKEYMTDVVSANTTRVAYRRWLIQDKGLVTLITNLTARWLSLSESDKSSSDDFAQGLQYLITTWKPIIKMIPNVTELNYMEKCSDNLMNLFNMLYSTHNNPMHEELIDDHWCFLLRTIKKNNKLSTFLENLTTLKTRAKKLIFDPNGARLADATLKIIDSGYPGFED